MAKRYDPTSQDYPATLGMPPEEMPTVSARSRYYGFSDDQIAQMKKAGITVGDLQGMGLYSPPAMETPVQDWTSGGGSGVSNPSTVGGQIMSRAGRQQLQNAAMLKASLAASAPQQSQQPGQTPSTPVASNLNSYLMNTAAGGQMYGAPAQAAQSSIPRGFNLYSPPPVQSIGAMSDLAVQPALVQPLSGNLNLGQAAGRQGGSFLSS